MQSTISEPRKRNPSHFAVFRSELSNSISSKSPILGCFHGGLSKGVWMFQLCDSPAVCLSRTCRIWGQTIAPQPRFIGILIYRCPSDRHFHRAPLLPNFPCFLSVTRFGAYPAPGGTRRSASHFVRPPGQGFQTKVSQRDKRARLRPRIRARFFFGASTESTPSALGAGHLASLRARVSRVQSGQIQSGEIEWHSMKTTLS